MHSFDLETLARARIAIDAEDNPEVIRAWGRLLDAGRIGGGPPPPLMDPARDHRLAELAALLGAQARA